MLIGDKKSAVSESQAIPQAKPDPETAISAGETSKLQKEGNEEPGSKYGSVEDDDTLPESHYGSARESEYLSDESAYSAEGADHDDHGMFVCLFSSIISYNE